MKSEFQIDEIKRPFYRRIWFRIGALIVVLIGATLFVDRAQYLFTRPKATELNDFLKLTTVGKIDHGLKNGETYTLVTGVRPPLWCIPTDPPAYVFDSRGHLVDWTRDLEHDRGIFDRWDDKRAKVQPKF